MDVDGHNFPNLALMKLSAWHQRQGDTVEFADPAKVCYDKVYMSKIFTFSRERWQLAYWCNRKPLFHSVDYEKKKKKPNLTIELMNRLKIKYAVACGFLAAAAVLIASLFAGCHVYKEEMEIIRCPVIEADAVYIPDWDKHNTVFDS